MGSFAWGNTAINRLEEFLQKLPGLQLGARCRGLGTTSPTVRQTTSQSGSYKSCSGFSGPLPPRIPTAGSARYQVRYPKEISVKGIICCILSHAARDHSSSLSVPEFSAPGIRLNIVKAWEPGSVLENITSLHRRIKDWEPGIKTEASLDEPQPEQGDPRGFSGYCVLNSV